MNANAPALGRVVVTGANGFLGKRLVQRLTPLCAALEGWTRAMVDLNDAAAVAHHMRATAPDIIFHLAAEGVRTPGMSDPGMAQRAVTMLNTLIDTSPPACAVIVAGSMTEVGHGGVISEDTECAPTTDYNRAKLATTRSAVAQAQSTGRPIVAARLFHLWGPGEPAHRLIPALIDGLTRGVRVPLSDGRQQRDFVHVDDAATALVQIGAACGQRAMPPLLNIGTGHGIEIADCARWIAHALGASETLLGFGDRARSPADQDILVADTARFVRTMNATIPQRLQPGLDISRLMDDAKY